MNEIGEKSSQCTTLEERTRALEEELEKKNDALSMKVKQSEEQSEILERLENELKTKRSEVEDISSRSVSLKEGETKLQEKIQEQSALLEKYEMKISDGEAERSELSSRESQQCIKIEQQETVRPLHLCVSSLVSNFSGTHSQRCRS